MLGDAANTSSYGISHDRRARVTYDWRADMLVLESESISYHHSISSSCLFGVSYYHSIPSLSHYHCILSYHHSIASYNHLILSYNDSIVTLS